MEITNNLTNINNTLANLIADDEYTSIGYVPILNVITPADIITIKKAQKLLDVVVIQNISEESLSDFSKNALKTLNPHLVIDKLSEESNSLYISFEIPSINSFNLIKGLLALLPSSVFVNQDNFDIFKAVTILENNFKDLFSLHNISTPTSIKSFKELDIIAELQSLEKSHLNINKSTILQYLSHYKVADYKEFSHNNSLFISVKIADEESKSTLNISYCFNLQ